MTELEKAARMALEALDEIHAGKRHPQLALAVAHNLRKALTQALAMEGREGAVRVCPEKDSVCGDRPGEWCRTCPKRPAPQQATPSTGNILMDAFKEVQVLKGKADTWAPTNKCVGSPGECAHNGACMYACTKLTQQATPMRPDDHLPDTRKMVHAEHQSFMQQFDDARENIKAISQAMEDATPKPATPEPSMSGWVETSPPPERLTWGDATTESAHPDDLAVDRFAVAMKAKLAASRAKGRGGWDNPGQCTVEHLARLLVDHVAKGDPVDVANFAMMLHQRGADRSVLSAATPERKGEPFGQVTVKRPAGSSPLYTFYPWPQSPYLDNVQECHTVYTSPQVPEGVEWCTVAEHGMPEIGEAVIGGHWYTDPWLVPEKANMFLWGLCRVYEDSGRDFPDGKRWQTFGPAHSQITHWARINLPAIGAPRKGE